MIDAIVIGAGIIGSTVALHLRKQKMEVLLLDDRRAMCGTVPSGGHLKPSWFGDMKKTDYEPAMSTLEDIWGLKEEVFSLPMKLKTTVWRVDTDQVVATEATNYTVTQIIQRPKHWEVQTEFEDYETKLLVVATGVWADEFLKVEKLQQKQGVSFRFNGILPKPFIRPWAPFKQVVAHQQSEHEIWVGDGSAILKDNWKDERTQQCLTRCREAIKATNRPIRVLEGLRAYCQHGSDPCLLKQVGRRCWLATGAGKSGTISAGWVANQIVEKLC